MAIYDTPTLDPGTVWGAMREAVSGGAALHVRFSRIRWFSHPRFVLWAEPEVDAVLLGWHAAIAASIAPALCHEHYRPGAWVPHCTLGTRIREQRRADAMTFARAFDQSFTVVFDVVDCVMFPPVEIIAQQKLP
ncbi:2'-5' RNA ligase family protein [Bradyrhizobium sp. HKCCYLS20291]|uniref:2'-5' RNA ligase family protein n=1 Tax=Bradyrhizobium sp. HKCCYLS20291 TaxID=3420766 RepID=UPI003EBD524F